MFCKPAPFTLPAGTTKEICNQSLPGKCHDGFISAVKRIGCLQLLRQIIDILQYLHFYWLCKQNSRIPRCVCAGVGWIKQQVRWAFVLLVAVSDVLSRTLLLRRFFLWGRQMVIYGQAFLFPFKSQTLIIIHAHTFLFHLVSHNT